MSMLFQRFHEFDNGETVAGLGYDIVIQRRHLGRLTMPTGELIACDPFYGLETEPFAQSLPTGDHPTILFAAELRDEIVPAYAMLQVSETEPVRWEAATIEESEGNPFDPHETGGYPVESNLGAFMDAASAKNLMDYTHAVMDEEDEYRRALRGRVRRRLKNHEKGYGWANIDLKYDAKVPQAPEDLNIIAFDAGYGPGIYSTYIGYDEDDRPSRVVTDFEVLDFRFQSFRMR
jgi:hypothetical protein